MQRVLRRNLLARNQALRRQRREIEEKLKDEKRKVRQERFEGARSTRSIIKSERTRRREDWLLGPLAPNRLAGKDSGGYGMLNLQDTRLPTVLQADRPKYLNVAVDDRVVVRTGREKGKIGKIMHIDEERQTVSLADVNIVSFTLPIHS